MDDISTVAQIDAAYTFCPMWAIRTTCRCLLLAKALCVLSLVNQRLLHRLPRTMIMFVLELLLLGLAIFIVFVHPQLHRKLSQVGVRDATHQRLYSSTPRSTLLPTRPPC